MARSVLVVINEQHNVMPDQKRALKEMFGEGAWERLNVPASGWTAVEQRAKLEEVGNTTLVFTSPVPLMLRDASQRPSAKTFVFHNDQREKVQRGDKVFYTVAKTGWKIL